MNKIRKGDQVIVLTGRDKGKRGTVTQRVDEERLVVEGVIDKTMSIHQSNVAIFNPATGKADRVGIKVLADATKVRVFRSSGDEIKA
jgi:large subunit ribosomal protein L24